VEPTIDILRIYDKKPPVMGIDCANIKTPLHMTIRLNLQLSVADDRCVTRMVSVFVVHSNPFICSVDSIQTRFQQCAIC